MPVSRPALSWLMLPGSGCPPVPVQLPSGTSTEEGYRRLLRCSRRRLRASSSLAPGPVRLRLAGWRC